MFWLTFIASIAFWPGVIDSALSPRWAILAIGIPVMLLLKSKSGRIKSPLRGLGFLFLLCVSISLFWTPDVYTGIYDLTHLLILSSAVVLGAELDNLDEVWKGLYCGVVVNIGILFLQYIGWSPVVGMTTAAGLFVNKEILAETALIAFVAALVCKHYKIAALMIVPILVCQSRTVWLASIVVITLVYVRNYKLLILLIVVGISSMTALNYTQSIDSFNHRIEMWSIVLSSLKLFGHGIGSWVSQYPLYEYVHNELLQSVYEIGIFTLIPVFIVFQLLRKYIHDSEYFIFVSIVAVSFFWFPYHMPITGFVTALAVGCIANRRNLFQSVDSDISVKTE